MTDAQWVQDNYDALREQYAGHYIAVKNQQVVIAWREDTAHDMLIVPSGAYVEYIPTDDERGMDVLALAALEATR